MNVEVCFAVDIGLYEGWQMRFDADANDNIFAEHAALRGFDDKMIAVEIDCLYAFAETNVFIRMRGPL